MIQNNEMTWPQGRWVGRVTYTTTRAHCDLYTVSSSSTNFFKINGLV
jgi:hypothetical protein